MEEKKDTKFTTGNPGRKKGSANQLTATSKRILADILEGREEEFNKVMDDLKEKKPVDYAHIYADLLKKALPQKLEIGDGSAKIVVTIKPKDKK